MNDLENKNIKDKFNYLLYPNEPIAVYLKYIYEFIKWDHSKDKKFTENTFLQQQILVALSMGLYNDDIRDWKVKSGDENT